MICPICKEKQDWFTKCDWCEETICQGCIVYTGPEGDDIIDMAFCPPCITEFGEDWLIKVTKTNWVVEKKEDGWISISQRKNPPPFTKKSIK